MFTHLLFSTFAAPRNNLDILIKVHYLSLSLLSLLLILNVRSNLWNNEFAKLK